MNEQRWEEGRAPTYFAPAERASEAEVRVQAEITESDPLFRAITLCVDGVLMVLNRQRQVVAVNTELLSALGIDQDDCLFGMRPGEVLQCVHAWEGPGGCGTSKTCATCGAVLAILASQREGAPSESECLATVERDGRRESHEFHVRAVPVQCHGLEFTTLVLRDISADKRREALEHLFYHDILNTIGGLRIWSSVLGRTEGRDPEGPAQQVSQLARCLEREVQDHRRLFEAEEGTLALHVERFLVADLLQDVRLVLSGHEAAQGRALVIEDEAPGDAMQTDRPLLLRVLTNMVLNAFEAVEEGEQVRVGHRRAEEGRIFTVHNPGVMADDVALRVFDRSFSTKGTPGRGLGAYSMKVFGERYLGGDVGFESTPEQGTTFFIRLRSQNESPAPSRMGETT